ncbi:hypothetical protein [Fusobacterium gonidiaformans]|uniref:hypothetical protein n=1 Tax=Fusobacterium gonidiaformans TaxID=849 RepID=UPI0023F353B9|nr:hypothetical protein [Fusobacterium gonidiaformans]
MNYKDMKKEIEKMTDKSHAEFVKALISFEKNIDDEDILEKLYEEYMENDNMGLLSEEFDNMIDELISN